MRFAKMVAVAALAISVHARSKIAAQHEAPDVTVYVDNGGAQFGLQAKVLAGRMLLSAGVHVAWRVGRPKAGAADGLVVGVGFVEAPPVDCERGVLARAYPFGGGVRRVTAFLDRIQASAEASGTEEYKLMAHVLVHEIGHVLAGNDHHAESGVMKAHWNAEDYRAMARNPLRFEEEDIAWIHTVVESSNHRDLMY